MKLPPLDRSDMLGKVRGLPDQLRSGFRIAEQVWESVAWPKSAGITIAGVGGSAIGGDLLRLYLWNHSASPVFVFRNRSLPRHAGEQVVVISSYSGNTEEALSCLRDAVAKRAFVVCVASGGQLVDEARRLSLPLVKIPPSLPPRAGLGYSFSALLALAWKVGLCPDPREELSGCADYLDGLSRIYSETESEANPATRLAQDLSGRVPVIFCSTALDAVGLRWKNQFCENSKQLAFVSVVPEANHNEIMGWEADGHGLSPGVVLLRTADDHPSDAESLSLVRETVRGGRFCGEFWGSGTSLLCRLFSLILLGDYASVYLALARGVDPTPIETIDKMKAWLKDGRKDG